MPETRKLHFSIAGEFITKLAREHFYESYNLKAAVDLLMSCLVTDKATEQERFAVAIKILDGKAELVGTYPGDDYRLIEYDERQRGVRGVYETISEGLANVKALRDKNEELSDKLKFVLENMSVTNLDRVSELWYNETGEELREEPDDEEYDGIFTGSDPMLRSFIQQAHIESKLGEDADDSYGWLEPNGTFHPVEWGEHQTWAYDYITEHGWPEAPKLNNAQCGDILLDHNWILLHSPHMGVPKATINPEKRVTKRQREFLYNYYAERELYDMAQEYLEA